MFRHCGWAVAKVLEWYASHTLPELCKHTAKEWFTMLRVGIYWDIFIPELSERLGAAITKERIRPASAYLRWRMHKN